MTSRTPRSFTAVGSRKCHVRYCRSIWAKQYWGLRHRLACTVAPRESVHLIYLVVQRHQRNASFRYVNNIGMGRCDRIPQTQRQPGSTILPCKGDLCVGYEFVGPTSHAFCVLDHRPELPMCSGELRCQPLRAGRPLRH